MDLDSDEEDLYVQLMTEACMGYRQRSCSVAKDNADRSSRGEFVTTFLERRKNGTVSDYIRLNNSQFDTLLGKLEHLISRERTATCPISAAERLAVTLRCLSHGIPFATLSHSFHMGAATVRKIVIQTSEAIFSVLSQDYVAFPSGDALKDVMNKFWDRWRFPNCFGAVDGKHVTIKAPNKSGSVFYNYKGTYSVVLMALVDADYNFLCVDIGSPGSECDKTVFDTWDFVRAIEEKQINLPASASLPFSDGTEKFEPVIVGDGGFALKEWVLIPYADNGNLTADQKIFNFRLSHARIVSENAFGILTQRWRILRKTMEFNPETVKTITLACIALHNWIRKTAPNCQYTPMNYTDRVLADGSVQQGLWRSENSAGSSLIPVRQAQNRASKNAYETRAKYLQYFLNEGSVKWQKTALTVGTNK